MSVYQRSALVFISEYKRLSVVQKNGHPRAIPPLSPRPFSPVKARGRKGAKRRQDSGFRLQASGETAKQPGGIEVSFIS
jgi:hypothetical protein